ncbi:MAG: indolepyruvate ferredoxin oxidoreductase family protein, partial [Pseudoxanthomonas sp.]
EAAGLAAPGQREAERSPQALRVLPPAEREGNVAGAPADPRDQAASRGLLERGDDGVAAPALDDARLSRSLDELIARRVAFLGDYQNAAWARRYAEFVQRVRSAEHTARPGSTALAEAVARGLFKLMAYKDEYEVARLYAGAAFKRQLEQQFEGDYRLRFHLAPPLWSKRNAQGQLLKREYGAWVLPAFRLLAKLKRLRGTAFDPFGHTAERRRERQWIGDYQRAVEALLPRLDAARLDLAVRIAALPERIRGYGHVKEAAMDQAQARLAELQAQWDSR